MHMHQCPKCSMMLHIRSLTWTRQDNTNNRLVNISTISCEARNQHEPCEATWRHNLLPFSIEHVWVVSFFRHLFLCFSEATSLNTGTEDCKSVFCRCARMTGSGLSRLGWKVHGCLVLVLADWLLFPFLLYSARILWLLAKLPRISGYIQDLTFLITDVCLQQSECRLSCLGVCLLCVLRAMIAEYFCYNRVSFLTKDRIDNPRLQILVSTG